MILSDKDIKAYMNEGKIRVEPCDLATQLQAVGIDLRLSNTFRLFKTVNKSHIDLAKEDLELDTELVEVSEKKPFVLHPGEFVLGMTMESVELPNDVAARIDGRSSLGRLGIIVHSTAGHIAPGWKGRITLEMTNIGKLPISLVPGMRFCSLIFERVSSPVEKPYKGKYSGDTMPAPSKITQEFKKG